MTNNDDYLFFLTCNPETQTKMIEDDKIISMYHVCGVNPWFVIYKSNSIYDAINHAEKFKFNIEYISIAHNNNLLEKIENTKINNIISWVFLKGISYENFQSFLEEITNEPTDYTITEAYKLFGEYQYIVKLHSNNINCVDMFLTCCRENGMNTTTKCILSILKENGEIIQTTVDEKIKNNTQYSIARIMANTKEFILKSTKEQKKY